METSDSKSTGFFADLLRKYRLRAGISQNHLAKISGVTQSHICQIEKGEAGRDNPRLSTVMALSEALNLPPAALVSPASTETVGRAVEAGLAAQEAGTALHLPDTLIQMAEAQAVSRAVTTEGRTK